MTCTPPHDISDRPVAGHLPTGPGAAELNRLMDATREILRDHPVNRKRVAAGERPITIGWLWGQGIAPQITPFEQLYGLRGGCISAVDLVRGVAVYAGFEIIHVPGATGFLDTDYAAKARYALDALADKDIVYIHIEAPDEAGHMGDQAAKIEAIESIDRLVIATLLERLPAVGDFKLLVTSDHPTPVSLRTHIPDAVPFAMATREELSREAPPVKYGEGEAAATGVVIPHGHTVISRLLAYPRAIAA